MIRTRGLDTVRVTKVKGHADDDDVQHGHVRLVDQQGNIEADIAADLGRRHQSEALINARRRLLQVSVNHDGKGGTAPDPLVWDQGSKPKVRKLAIRVNVDIASLPGPLGFLIIIGFRLMPVTSLVLILVFWLGFALLLVPYTGLLVLLTWVILGFPFWNFLSFFEQWAGHRLLSQKKVTRPHVRAGRPILLPSVPVSEGIEIRRGCQFLSCLVRALAKLPGGLGRFLPCSLGSHMSRLRHLGWNQCSHGLIFRPLESCHHQCLKAVCGVLGYPKGSALELLDGTLKLRHCTEVFTMRLPPWSLPRVGNAVGKRHVITPGHLLDACGDMGKRVRLTRKTRPGESSHDIPDPGHPTPKRWKRLRPFRSGG